MLAEPLRPASTPEFDALVPQPGESPMDALSRVGDSIVPTVAGDEDKDSRKDKKLPKQLAALVALRAQGFDNAEIAQRLGVSRQKVYSLIAKARKTYGWDDLADKLANVAVPIAVDNVIRHLEHEQTEGALKMGMSTMTRSTLSGVGMFKSHAAAKVETKSEHRHVLRVEIMLPTLPPGDQGTGQVPGVLATPRRAQLPPHPTPAATVIEGEVIHAGK